MIEGVVLGRGAPNRTRDGRAVVCAIVLCDPPLGLVRLYPLRADDDLTVWTRIRCELERDPAKDARSESYRAVACEAIGRVEDRSEKAAILDACVLRSATEDPVDFQNRRRRSIAVVRPRILGGLVVAQEPDASKRDEAHEDGWLECQREMSMRPVVRWESEQGRTHEQTVVAQETNLWLTRNRQRAFQVFDNMRLLDAEYRHWLVLGNMRNRLSAWVVVHVHRLKKAGLSPPLAGLCAPAAGDWPYGCQETENVRCEGNGQICLPFAS